jgi:hypothetical protein
MVVAALMTDEEELVGILNIVLSAASGVKGREVLSRRNGYTVAKVENVDALSAKFWALASVSTRLKRTKVIFMRATTG